MAEIVIAPNIIKTGLLRRKLFLAGGINGCPDWQSYVISKLRHLEDLIIFNPRRDVYDLTDKSIEQEQISWEHAHLTLSDVKMFWFAKETLQPISLYELGRYVNSVPSSSKSIVFLGVHPKYPRKNDVYIQTSLDRPDIRMRIATSLDELIDQYLKVLG
jgi:hypothetical protein